MAMAAAGRCPLLFLLCLYTRCCLTSKTAGLSSPRVAIKIMFMKILHKENAYYVTLCFIKALNKNAQKNTDRKSTLLLIIVTSGWRDSGHLNFLSLYFSSICSFIT